MSRPIARQRSGFTLVEVVLGSVVSTIVVGSFMSLWDVSEAMSTTSRTSMRGEAEHRSNLAAIAALFRDVAPASLAGFDVYGRSTTPRFKRVTGVDGTTPRLGAEQSLLWLAVNAWGLSPSGAQLGQVVVRTGASDRVLARQVPQGGFRVVRAGRVITIHLTTCWESSDAGAPHESQDQIEICLRN